MRGERALDVIAHPAAAPASRRAAATFGEPSLAHLSLAAFSAKPVANTSSCDSPGCSVTGSESDAIGHQPLTAELPERRARTAAGSAQSP